MTMNAMRILPLIGAAGALQLACAVAAPNQSGRGAVTVVTNDFAVVLKSMYEGNVSQIRDADGDRLWSVKTTGGGSLSALAVVEDKILGIGRSSGDHLPQIGVNATDEPVLPGTGKLVGIEPGECYFHPGSDSGGGLRIERRASELLTRFKVMVSVRAVHTAWGAGADGIIAGVYDSTNVLVGLAVTTTVDRAVHTIETDWIEGDAVSVALTRNSAYGYDGSGVRILVVEEKVSIAKDRFKETILTQQVNQYVSANSEDYSNSVPVERFTVGFGKCTTPDGEITLLAHRLKKGLGMVGWDAPGGLADLPFFLANTTGADSAVDGWTVKADEFYTHPGAGIFSAIRLTASKCVTEGCILEFQVRTIHESATAARNSPGEQLYVFVKGVKVAEYSLLKEVGKVSLPVQLPALERGDTVDFVLRSMWDGGKQVSCDACAVKMVFYRPKTGLTLILR